MMFRLFLIFLAVAGAGSQALAQTLSPGDLPAGAQWYVHVNTALLRDSALTAPFYEESLGEAFDDISQELGVDLARDITAVSVFGSARGGNQAAVVLHGALSPDNRARLDELMASAAHFVEHDYGGMRYFEVSGLGEPEAKVHHEPDHAMLVHFAPDRTLVSTRRDTMHRLLDPARDPLEPAADGETLLVLRASQALLQAGLNARDVDLHRHWDSKLLNNIEQAAGVVSESGGGLRVRLEVLAADADTALYVQNILQGLISLRALAASDEPWLNELVAAVKLQAEDRRVTLDLDIPPELAEQIIDEM